MTPKQKTVFFCQNCGYESAKWTGKCPSCNEWNTFSEEIKSKTNPSTTGISSSRKESKLVLLDDIVEESLTRISITDAELARVLGGGIVPGSVTLVSGEPGIGKSTLMLQLALYYNKKIVYVSGEESAQQIKMRASRISKTINKNIYLLTETNTQEILKKTEEINPTIIIIDSIQTLYSNSIESGMNSISQIRQCTSEIIHFAKTTKTSVFLIGHITKDGSIAGPKVLEHMVDTVLYFEGDRHYSYRLLRTTKNRFGSTSELGIYEMNNDGLRQINNPSEILLSQKDEDINGIAIASSIEGNRQLMIEIQSLVSTATYGTPQRTSTGYDLKRLNMLLAVLEKRCGFRLASQDVFLNIAGGFKIEDPAIDLAICCSILSSLKENVISDKVCFAGEIGLGGEIRSVNKLENRINEAEKLGFKKIYISKYGIKRNLNKYRTIQIIPLSKINDVIDIFF